MELKVYQNRVVEQLLIDTAELLKRDQSKKLIFKSPTGSGKTIMTAEFLKRLVTDSNLKFKIPFLSFIWAAPRKLHEQSKEKLENYYENSRALKCSFFEDLDEKKIAQDEILFFNWESINKSDNIYIRDNENDFNLSSVIKNTREEGRKIVLIIDESHFSAEGDSASKLRSDINADLTIEVSATPQLSADKIVEVDIEEVKDEAMIKKGVILNENFGEVLKDDVIKIELKNGTDKVLIEEALKKRQEIKKSFEKIGSYINPLLLIQLPDRKTKHEDILKDKIIKILKDNNITIENSKLAIHLSEDKQNLENIRSNADPTEVLIFKQAIALGWDCPRAQIMVLFREWHSKEFSIQTVGRLMRMPEPNSGYYKEEILNFSYIYTNLSDVDIIDDIARDYITIYESRRKAIYENLDLTSCHSKRQREKTRLASSFVSIFLKKTDEYDLIKKIKVNDRKISSQMIHDWYTENIHDIVRKEEGLVDYELSDEELQILFDRFIIYNLSPLYPEERSIGRIKQAIYRFFANKLELQYDYSFTDIMQIILSENNSNHFSIVIKESIEEYLRYVTLKEKELIIDAKWNIPERIRFNERYTKFPDIKKSIMDPAFLDTDWRSEINFVNYLEKNSDNIEWWFKNGDRDAVYFAVPYIQSSEKKPFYVDYIVQYKDKSIGLYDTKSGNTLMSSFDRMDGLYKYIKEQNKLGKKIIGGIVTNTQANYKGRWVCFEHKSTEFLENDFSNWSNLKI